MQRRLDPGEAEEQADRQPEQSGSSVAEQEPRERRAFNLDHLGIRLVPVSEEEGHHHDGQDPEGHGHDRPKRIASERLGADLRHRDLHPEDEDRGEQRQRRCPFPEVHHRSIPSRLSSGPATTVFIRGNRFWSFSGAIVHRLSKSSLRSDGTVPYAVRPFWAGPTARRITGPESCSLGGVHSNM